MREYHNLRDQLSRRQYAQLLAGVGFAGLAGCPSEGGDGPTAGSGSTATETPTDTGSGSTPTATDEPTDTTEPTETDEPTPEGDPVTDTVRVFKANSPSVFDANTWTPQDNSTGVGLMTELHSLRNVHIGKAEFSGLEIETPWKAGRDSASIMTWFTGFEVDPPYDVYERLDDRATYWNGDPLDADAREMHEHVSYFQQGNKFNEETEFASEAASQWEYHWWNTDGSGNLPDDPQAKHVLEANAASADTPLHPDFTRPYLEQYQDASSADAVSSVSDDLASDRIDLQRLMDEGWGSGPYELRSDDDIGSARLTLRLRDEAAASAGETALAHPNAANTNVPKLAILWGEGDRRKTLATNGSIDLNGNIVAPDGLFSRETLPDHMQELTRWLRSSGGDKWRLNWNDEHLQNLWVRRALVAAVDWTKAGTNGWGDERSVPMENHTYMLDGQSQATFSSDFLESLHKWPMESDFDAGTTYLQKGGYTKQGGQWVGPNGNPASIDLIYPSAIGDYAGAAQTIKANLSKFGFGVNFSSQGWSSWSNNLKAENGLNYDSSIFWHGYGNPFGYYNSTPGWWSGTLVMGKAESPTQPVDRDTEMDSQGKPLQVEIPSEVGSIEAPEEAGPDPDLADGEEINLASIVTEIREPGKSEAEVQELYRTCARYYNFYLPHFVFHQYTWGAWGNVRDFEWPDKAHRGLDYESGFGLSSAIIKGGLTEASYDTDFPAPD